MPPTITKAHCLEAESIEPPIRAESIEPPIRAESIEPPIRAEYNQ